MTKVYTFSDGKGIVIKFYVVRKFSGWDCSIVSHNRGETSRCDVKDRKVIALLIITKP